MAYSLDRGYEQQGGSQFDDKLYDSLVKFGFTHEAFVPGLSSYRISQGQSKHQMIGSVALPAATAFTLTAWLTGQTHVSLGSAAFTAITGVSPGQALAPALPIVGITAAVIMVNELQTSMHSNLGVQEIPGSQGGYTNPMGGSGETYYPFKGLIDWITQ